MRRPEPRGEAILRRLLDVLCSSAFLLLVSPLMALIAALVKLSSPGPIIFRQQRVGRNGVPFWLYKFRTMRVASNAAAFTPGERSRITQIGRVLRRYKLDELPQFFNVLCGDMSLVGPRPEVAEYVQHYTDEQREVLSVRPGITGVSQVEFRHEESLLAGRADAHSYYLNTIMPYKLSLDLRYVRERTLALDLRVLIRTAQCLVSRESSEPASLAPN